MDNSLYLEINTVYNNIKIKGEIMNKYKLKSIPFEDDAEYSDQDYIIYSFSAFEIKCDYSISIGNYNFNELVIYISDSSNIMDSMKVYFSKDGIKPFREGEVLDSYKGMKDFLEIHEEFLVNIFYSSLENQNEYVNSINRFEEHLRREDEII